MKQEMMRWQWHHLDSVEIIFTLLLTDNYTSMPGDCLEDRGKILCTVVHNNLYATMHT